MERTQASSWAMSVSSSHCLTSRRMEDLATSAGFLAFFSAYCRSLSSCSRAASLSSSSLPNRSVALSSSSTAAVAAFLPGAPLGSRWCHSPGVRSPPQARGHCF
uniref:Uncharacterized protein n=1 Tax=Neovison vison TaxID=452646 RepID=A0A8C7A6W7_NEOVI